MSFPRYPEYKDSGVEWLGPVPAHWDVTPLKWYCSVMPSNVDKKSYDGELPVRLCNYTDVYYNERITAHLPFMEATASPEQVSRFSLRAGDVIVTKDSETANDIAIGALVPDDLPGVVCGYHLALLRLSDDRGGRFLKYLFDATTTKDYVATRANGLTRVGLSQSALDSMPTAVPPIEERLAIASFLDRETAKIDALVAEQERLIALLKEKRQAVISHAVTKGLNPDAPMKDTGVEWIGEIPAHWENATLVRIASRVVVGIAEAATHAYVDDGVPILRSTNIRPGKIAGEVLRVDRVFAGDREAKLLRAGDLVTVRTGNAGVTAVIYPELDGCQCFTMLITTLLPGNHSEFYQFWMNALPSQRYFSLEGWGTAQTNISVPILKALPIPIPPISEQMAVVRYLHEVLAEYDALVEEAQNTIQLFNERRRALITAAVTGQIDVRGLAPAAAA